MGIIGSQSRILHILKYLWQKTDEEHPASIAEIIGYLNENGIEAHRHTVTAAIEQLMEFGMNIVCVRSTQNRYFLAERILEMPELKLLWVQWTPRGLFQSDGVGRSAFDDRPAGGGRQAYSRPIMPKLFSMSGRETF